MKIALTGISGFIGSSIAKHAVTQGHEIIALVRKTSRRDHIESFVSTFVTGTHDDQEAVKSLVSDADVVIHDSLDWEAIKSGDLLRHLRSNLEGSIQLLEASEQRQFIYMSTIAVHHHMHEKWGGTIDEAHPTRPGTLYGACKASVEAHLWAHAAQNQRVTSMRPCAVYGIDPNFKRSIGYPIVRAIEERKPFTKLGGGKFVHVDDVASATVAAIHNDNASPSVYNLVDCYARWADWAQIASEELGVEAAIDFSSAKQPKNTFDTTDVTTDLGVEMNRGFSGIRKQIREIIDGK